MGVDGGHQALWSCRSPLTGALKNVMPALERPVKHPIRFYGSWRFILYVPLSHHGAYASGITAFVDRERTVGLHVAGLRQRAFEGARGDNGAAVVGSPGAPNHLALGPGERITGMWALQIYRSMFDDHLVVKSLVRLLPNAPKPTPRPCYRWPPRGIWRNPVKAKRLSL